MSTLSGRLEDRRPARHAGVPRWILLALPVCIVFGVVLGLYSTSAPRLFSPPAGPPGSLRLSGIPLPRTPPVLGTEYLERVVENKSARELEIERFANRYYVTEPLARMIHEAALEQGIDPELAFRLIRVESVFDATASNPAGGLGLCQLMLGTARDIDSTITTRKQLMDPRTNLRVGLINLRNMIERYHGDVRLGVIAYNRGEIAVDRALKRGRDPENGYGKLVLGPVAHGGKPYTGKGLVPKVAPPPAPPARDDGVAGLTSGAGH